MAAEWSLVWASGSVRLEGDRLELEVGRKRRAVRLANATIRIARWSHGGSLYAGAVVVVHDGDRIVSIAGAYTPRCTRFDGVVKKPTAIVAPDSLRELIDALGDRIAKVEVDLDAPFALVPRTGGATWAWIGFLVLTLAMMVPAAFDAGVAATLGTIAALVATIALAIWVAKRTRRFSFRAEEARDAIAGHTVMYSRFATVRAPAVALTIHGRRIVVQSMEGATTVRGPRLRGWNYRVPADEFDRLLRRVGWLSQPSSG